MSILRNLKIRYKIQIASILIGLLAAFMLFTFLPLRRVLDQQLSTTTEVNKVVVQTMQLTTVVQQYLLGTASFQALEEQFKLFRDSLVQSSIPAKVGDRVWHGDEKARSVEDQATRIWQKLAETDSRLVRNRSIQEEVAALTTESIGNSNNFINAVSQRLADPAKQGSVSRLERQVIAGANMNNNANFTIQLLFKEMAVNPEAEGKLFQFLDLAVANATTDVERLARTPFAQLPVAAVAANRKVQELGGEYVANQESISKTTEEVSASLTELQEVLNEAQARLAAASVTGVFAFFKRTLIWTIALAIALIVLQILIARSITKPIGRAIEVLRQMELGNLAIEVKAEATDETGQMIRSLGNMIAKLRSMISEVRIAAEQVASSSEEISSSAQQLSSGAQNQASTLEETSASVEELTASVEQVSDHAQSQAASVEESSSNMSQMQSSVQQVSETLGEVSTPPRSPWARPRRACRRWPRQWRPSSPSPPAPSRSPGSST